MSTPSSSPRIGSYCKLVLALHSWILWAVAGGQGGVMGGPTEAPGLELLTEATTTFGAFWGQVPPHDHCRIASPFAASTTNHHYTEISSLLHVTDARCMSAVFTNISSPPRLSISKCHGSYPSWQLLSSNRWSDVLPRSPPFSSSRCCLLDPQKV